MKKVPAPDQLTYIAAFLTFRCSLGCGYCINRHDRLTSRKELTTKEWLTGLNRLIVKRDLMVPLTLQGGEPSTHTGFTEIIKDLTSHFYIDILTNLEFDIDAFMEAIPPDRLKRNVPYASIRASYHPGYADFEKLISKVLKMQNRGFSIGLFTVDHPSTDIDKIRNKVESYGIDFRTKEFLGIFNDTLYGEYLYQDAVGGKELKFVQCKRTELLIAPDGYIHRCHRDLYSGENPTGHILDNDLELTFSFRECHRYGECNPCDIKVKNNRFQEFGHCSVVIQEEYGTENKEKSQV